MENNELSIVRVSYHKTLLFIKMFAVFNKRNDEVRVIVNYHKYSYSKNLLGAF